MSLSIIVKIGRATCTFLKVIDLSLNQFNSIRIDTFQAYTYLIKDACADKLCIMEGLGPHLPV